MLPTALALLLAGGYAAARYAGLLQGRAYSAQELGIPTAVSPNDADGDGIDDYRDILLGARADAERHPDYDPSYVAGGYPPDDKGVCTDVVWRALKNAGYDLKGMLDADIAAHPERYPRVGGAPDPNIDFRRVPNLRAFLDVYAERLTTDLSDPAQWQPGDIVIFGENKHIGILSDQRTRGGVPWLIHNSGQPRREENALEAWNRAQPISAHYRWTAEDPGPLNP